LPKALKEAKIKKGEQVFRQKKNVLFLLEREEGCVDAEHQTHCPDHKDFQQAREGKYETTGCC
jgi:hypothetical protein